MIDDINDRGPDDPFGEIREAEHIELGKIVRSRRPSRSRLACEYEDAALGHAIMRGDAEAAKRAFHDI